MIAAALFLTALVQGPQVVEVIDPEAQEVSIQAIIPTPGLTNRDFTTATTLVDALPREVEGYSRRDVLSVTGGMPLRAELGPDHIRVSMIVPAENWRSGLSLLETLVRRPRYTAESLQSANDSLARRAPDYWTLAIRPREREKRQTTLRDLNELHERLFRPDTIVLGIGGRLSPGQAAEEWHKRTESWRPARTLPPLADGPESLVTAGEQGVDTIELGGAPFGARDAALPTRILAAFALGAGKASSVFRVARQKLGWSYRQEAILYPVPSGWQPRVLVTMRSVGDAATRAETLRSALLEDVRGWSEAERRRALGMAEGVLLRDVDFDPLYVTASGPAGHQLEGRTFLNTYWRFKTGEAWNASALLDRMRSVTLADLKEAAQQGLATGTIRILKG